MHIPPFANNLRLSQEGKETWVPRRYFQSNSLNKFKWLPTGGANRDTNWWHGGYSFNLSKLIWPGKKNNRLHPESKIFTENHIQ